MAIAQTLPHLEKAESSLNAVQRHYLKELNRAELVARRLFFVATWGAVRLAFRTKVTGLDHFPRSRPFIIAPNHTSSLDPFLLSASLPYTVLKHCHWAAAGRAIMKSRARRALNRLAGSVPIWRSAGALSVGVVVLERGKNLVWFPEGHRTRTGQLQEFRPGIGILAVHTGVPVVPIRIVGGYEAMPPGRHFPQLRSRIEIRVGEPLQAESTAEELFEQRADRFTQRLYQAMVQLGESR